MAEATPQEVQQTSDEIVRPLAQQFRGLIANCRAAKAGITDVYNACNDTNFVWADNRQDGPPHLNGKQDILVANAIINLFIAFVDGVSQAGDSAQFLANYPIFEQSCVHLPE